MNYIGIMLVWAAGIAQNHDDPQKKQIEELIKTINQDADILHRDYTPSVRKLIGIGEPAIPQVLELLLSESKDTRLHAQRVLVDVTAKQHGFRPGRGWVEEGGQARWNDWWEKLGDLDWQSPQKERTKSVELWRAWLCQRKLGKNE